jgi:hypothetical protein
LFTSRLPSRHELQRSSQETSPSAIVKNRHLDTGRVQPCENCITSSFSESYPQSRLRFQSAPKLSKWKYRGAVNLDCTDIDRSSFVKRICYDRTNKYMLINLGGTYYHYCEIDGETVAGLVHADSIGRFFNANIKGQFDCPTHRVPNYWPGFGSVSGRPSALRIPLCAIPRTDKCPLLGGKADIVRLVSNVA